MKKLVYIGLLLLFGSCEKNDVFTYDQPKNSIQFNYSEDNMKLDFDFAFQSHQIERYPNSFVTEYYGDNFRDTVIALKITVLGFKSEQDQPVTLKLVPVEDQDTSGFACVELLSSGVVRANRLKDTVYIRLHRPETRGKHAVGITFQLNEESFYARGVEEQFVYRINISDRYPKPSGWNDNYFGEYSEEKYAFYVTTLKSPYLKREPYDWLYEYDNTNLRQALEVYNAAHPDAPKDFDFPEI